jgi:hypothetical protein
MLYYISPLEIYKALLSGAYNVFIEHRKHLPSNKPSSPIEIRLPHFLHSVHANDINILEGAPVLIHSRDTLLV